MNKKLILPFLFILISGVFFTVWTVKHENKFRLQSLQDQVSVIARSISPERLQRLTNEHQGRTGADFQALYKQLQAVLLGIEDGSFLYLMGLNEEQEVVFLMDVEPVAVPEDPVEPGTIYEDASLTLKEALRKGFRFTEGPLKDDWGTWISAFSPVIAQGDNQPLAMLGVDIDAAQWNRNLLRSAKTPALISMLILLVAILGKRITQERGIEFLSPFTLRRAPFFTLILGLLISTAITNAVRRLENHALTQSIREEGLVKAGEIFQLFRELDQRVFEPVSKTPAPTSPEERTVWQEHLQQQLTGIPLQNVYWIEASSTMGEPVTVKWSYEEETLRKTVPVLQRQVQSALESDHTSVYLDENRTLWITHPIGWDDQNDLITVKVDLGSFFFSRLRESEFSRRRAQTRLSLHSRPAGQPELLLGRLTGDEILTPDTFMIPWLGFDQAIVARVWPTPKRAPRFLDMGPMAWTSLFIGVLLSLASMMLVADFMSRQLQLQQQILSDQEKLKISEARLEKINRCFLDFGSDPNANIQSLVLVAREVLNTTLAMYLREEGGRIEVVESSPPFPEGWTQETLRKLQCIQVLEDANEEHCILTGNLPENDPRVNEFGLKTYIGQKILLEEKPAGVFSIMFSEEVTLSDTESHVISMICSAIRIEEKRRLAMMDVTRRDRLLQSVASLNERLLSEKEVEDALNKGLIDIGKASGQDRVYIFDYRKVPGQDHGVSSLRHEWVKPGIAPQLGNPDLQDFPLDELLPRWSGLFKKQRSVKGLVRTFPPEEKAILEPQDIRSILVVPIYKKETFWGFIGFDNCTEDYNWSGNDTSILKSLAYSIGTNLLRREAENTLLVRNQELKDSVERAKRLAKESEKANAAKGEFLARMSHEIRTPMNGVLGMARLMEMDPLPEEQKEKLEVIIQSGEMLLHIINDILDFSKIEAGEMILEREPFELKVLLDSLHRLLAPKADDKGVRYLNELSDGIPGLLVGDPLRIRQVLMNLIYNGIKFTEEGSVTTNVFPEKTQEGRMMVVFEVTDTGPGIAPDQIELLFQEFKQLDGSAARKYEGTGLGLSIVKRLVDLMAGTIEVDSTLGKGSTFRVKLPLSSATGDQISHLGVHQSTSGEDRSLQGRRVLIVDDDIHALNIITSILTPWGCKTEPVDSPIAALEMLIQAEQEEAPFHYVLLDMMMPEWDGLELAKRIKKHPIIQHQPKMIMLSNLDVSKLKDEMNLVGIHGHLTKPIHPSRLFDLLVEEGHVALEATPSVLVVDDDPSMVEFISRLLPNGLKIYDAGNTRDAEQLILENAEIGLVVCDHDLPGEKGLDFCQRIHQHHKDLICIMMSGMVNPEVFEPEISSGTLFGFIPKPLAQDDIRNLFDQAFQALERRPEPSRSVHGTQHGSTVSDKRLPAGKVLVAEDNKVNQIVVKKYLSSFQIEVQLVQNGKEAFDALKQNSFAAVFMDLHMPVMDGLEATRKIREWEAQEGRSAIPIIALTADAIKGDREKCLEAQMDDYLTKPLKTSALEAVLRKFDLIPS